MKKRYKEYFTLLVIFLVFLFKNSINDLIIIINKDFNFSNVYEYSCINEIEENKNLKNIINTSTSDAYNYTYTRVKYRDLLDYSSELVTFKGTNDGIESGLAVINDLGLVGTIKETGTHTSTVKLITNKSSNISVKIKDTFGILKSKDGTLIVTNITNYDEVTEGDKVYTSGIGTLPGDILVGSVKKIEISSEGIEKILTIEPVVNFNKLSYLMIVGVK